MFLVARKDKAARMSAYFSPRGEARPVGVSLAEASSAALRAAKASTSLGGGATAIASASETVDKLKVATQRELLGNSASEASAVGTRAVGELLGPDTPTPSCRLNVGFKTAVGIAIGRSGLGKHREATYEVRLRYL